MAEVGKSLVFYMRYYGEMQRLYAQEGTFEQIEKHPDHDAIMRKISEVGREAGVQARVLLEACMAETRQRLTMANVVRLNAPMNKTVEKHWQIAFTVLPLKKNDAGRLAQIGIYLDSAGIFLWAWARGGVSGEQRIHRLLRGKVEAFGSKQFGWDGGTIGFKPVPIQWSDAKDFTLDADALIAETSRRLEAITPEFVAQLIKQN